MPDEPRQPRTSHRPFNRRWKDNPPRPSFEASPPEYNVWDTSGPKGERLLDLRNHKHLTKRGGWKRFLLIILLAIATVVALGVGLGIGLTRKNQMNEYVALLFLAIDPANDGFSASAPTTTSAPSAAEKAFPAGSWSFPAYLTTSTANCTSNPSTWQCAPSATYAPGSNESLVTFQWIIAEVGDSKDYTISTSSNPFAISITNISLSLLDANTNDERYHFSLPFDQFVTPSSDISGSNRKAGCWFNQTSIEANIFTRKPFEDTSSSLERRASSGWEQWPFAVEVSQSIHGGEEVPNCYEMNNTNLGARITNGVEDQPSDAVCECEWKNFDL